VSGEVCIVVKRVFVAIEWECLPDVVLSGFVWCVPDAMVSAERFFIPPVTWQNQPLVLVGRPAGFTLLKFLRGAFRPECAVGFVGLSVSAHPRNQSRMASVGLVHATFSMRGGFIIEGGDPHAGRPLISPLNLGPWGFHGP
jgi:hypothetical protein